MQLKFNKDSIEFKKEENALDLFVHDFVNLLDKLKIKYVLVSGYVAILFGRNRSSEDIDIFIENISFDKFQLLWNELAPSFECIITSKSEDAYQEYLMNNDSIRFARKGQFIPNMEIKFPKTELDKWTLLNSTKVIMNGNSLAITKLELQVAFKLFLGSEKDIEDARFLHDIFKDHLDSALLQQFARRLKIEDSLRKYLK